MTLLPWRSGCRAIGGTLVGGRLKTLSSVCLPSSPFLFFKTENCCSDTGNTLFLEQVFKASCNDFGLNCEQQLMDLLLQCTKKRTQPQSGKLIPSISLPM